MVVHVTRICQDKYIVEVDVFSSNVINLRLDIRDTMDMMTNMDILHMWFDTVQAVVDASINDGNGNINYRICSSLSYK